MNAAISLLQMHLSTNGFFRAIGIIIGKVKNDRTAYLA